MSAVSPTINGVTLVGVKGGSKQAATAIAEQPERYRAGAELFVTKWAKERDDDKTHIWKDGNVEMTEWSHHC